MVVFLCFIHATLIVWKCRNVCISMSSERTRKHLSTSNDFKFCFNLFFYTKKNVKKGKNVIISFLFLSVATYSDLVYAHSENVNRLKSNLKVCMHSTHSIKQTNTNAHIHRQISYLMMNIEYIK